MKKSFTLFLSILIVPSAALAWGNMTAHPAINREAFKLFSEQQKNAGDGKGGITIDTETTFEGEGITAIGKMSAETGPLNLTLSDWLFHGGISADEPEMRAAWRHFYDPHSIAGEGLTYLTDHVPDSYGVNPQIDAKAWALSHKDNLYSFEAATKYYREAFGWQAENSKKSYAHAFRALGETMHLVADMAQPAHVRNDAHAFSEPVEDNLDASTVQKYAGKEVPSGISLEDKTVPEIFDLLATFTNENFYSNDTIYNKASPEILPLNGQTPNEKPQFSSFVWEEKTRQFNGFGSLKIPMAAETLRSFTARKVAQRLSEPEELPIYHIPPSFTSGQAQILVPIAVNANVMLLSRFFPVLKLEVELTSVDSGTIKVGGRLVHDIGKADVWPTALSYSGPGTVMKRTASGTGGERILGVVFEDGVVTTPLEVKLDSEEMTVYLQVKTGGLIIESPDTALAEPGEEDVWIMCSKEEDKGETFKWTHRACYKYTGKIEPMAVGFYEEMDVQCKSVGHIGAVYSYSGYTEEECIESCNTYALEQFQVICDTPG